MSLRTNTLTPPLDLSDVVELRSILSPPSQATQPTHSRRESDDSTPKGMAISPKSVGGPHEGTGIAVVAARTEGTDQRLSGPARRLDQVDDGAAGRTSTDVTATGTCPAPRVLVLMLM
jgi:hypothetical protein